MDRRNELKVVPKIVEDVAEELHHIVLGGLPQQLGVDDGSRDDIYARSLKVGYDLLGDEEKDLFLDIACFFVGEDKDCVATILERCGFHAEIGIRTLIDRSLLTVNEDNKLMMHRLVQDMGREIVRQESPLEPSKRSRLWRREDDLHVLLSSGGGRTMGTEAIEGLALEFRASKYEESYCLGLSSGLLPTVISSSPSTSSSSSSATKSSVETAAFSNMRNLRVLKLRDVGLTGGYEDFPKNLRWLSWHGLLTVGYDVSLNFSDEFEDDTCKTLPDRLFAALEEAGLHTFKDNQKIEREEARKRIIQHSKCCIIILSSDYVSSKRRLDELVMIVDLFSTSPHRILPVCCNVEKSVVMHQLGSLRAPFSAYEKEIEEETDDEMKGKLRDDVRRWRAALKHVAKLPGFNFPNGAANGTESENLLIKKIVLEARETAKHKVSKPPQQRLVGVDIRAKPLQNWVDS